jgi:hypothetical protein
MRFWFAALLIAVVMAGGCASIPVVAPTDTTISGRDSDGDSKMIITPEELLVGTVASYNTAGRFVVLDFPVGQMPVLDQVLFIYRRGLKVGEVKVGAQRLDYLAVADLIAGEAQKGDEVRDR